MTLPPIENFLPCQNCGNDDQSRFEKREWSDLGYSDPDPRFKETPTQDTHLPGKFWVCRACGEMPNRPGDISDLSADDIRDA